MEIGETVNIPIVTEQACGECGNKIDIYQMFENLTEPAEDAIGLPELKVKCPYCGGIVSWGMEFTT